MSNKPKLEAAKSAYTLTERGSYEQAYRQFLSLYELSGHIASGYNAALLLEALNRLPEAVDLMNDVFNRSGSQQAYTALLRMQEAKSQSEKAQRQISGESAQDGQGVMMMQYVVME
jgi:tetratricopeptide (TPR) repeat protein